MRTSSGPMTEMTANGEVRLNRVATVYVKQRTYSSQVCFFKRLSQCFQWRNSAKNMGIHTTGPAVRIHISSRKRQENGLQYIQLCTICGSWNIIESFFHCTHTYFLIISITGFCIWRKQIHRKSSTRKKWKYEWRDSVRPAAWCHRNRKPK